MLPLTGLLPFLVTCCTTGLFSLYTSGIEGLRKSSRSTSFLQLAIWYFLRVRYCQCWWQPLALDLRCLRLSRRGKCQPQQVVRDLYISHPCKMLQEYSDHYAWRQRFSSVRLAIPSEFVWAVILSMCQRKQRDWRCSSRRYKVSQLSSVHLNSSSRGARKCRVQLLQTCCAATFLCWQH